MHAQFNILPPSANFSPHFGGLITFEDADLSIAGSADIPGTGAYVGRLETVAHLGLANDGCNSEVPVTFNLTEANTNIAAHSIDTPPAMPGTATDDPLLLNGAITTGATTLAYDGASGTDPLGVRADGLPINEIRIDSEEMLITAVNTATNTYTVTRGWNGTTPAAHADNVEIRKVNVIYPAGPATNLQANQGEDDGNLDNFGSAEFADMANNRVADGAESVPSYVRDSLDPNNNPDDGGYVQPHARYVGVAFVANTLVVVLQFIIMSPGALTVFPNLDWATPAWGWASVTFLQDPLSPPSNSAITDFCNFKSNTLLYGTTHDNACTSAAPPVGCTAAGAGFLLRLAVDGGCPGLTTPNECGTSCAPNCPSPPCDPGACYRSKLPLFAQAVRFYQYAVSQRDYDNDGHENALDPCHSTPNPEWNPRDPNSLSNGDSDADGVPDACDPNPDMPSSDVDGDGWQNRIDNCPIVANSGPGGSGATVPNTFQYDSDVPPGQDVGDSGLPSDDIGPACDIAANSCAGCPVLTPTGPNGHYHAKYAAQTICIGAQTSDCSFTADNDGDGVVNATDTCIDAPNPPRLFSGPFGRADLTQPANAGDSTIIVSGGVFTVGSPIVIDSPLETLRYITSKADNAINITPPLNFNHNVRDPVAQAAFAQSTLDLNNNGSVGVIDDMAEVSNAAFTVGGNPHAPPGYQARLDVNDDSRIDVVGDLATYSGAAFLACGPP